MPLAAWQEQLRYHDDERRGIARKAVKARWARHLPQAAHEGVIRFGDIEIEAAVLNDGQRVITYSGFMMGLGRPSNGRQHHRAASYCLLF
ncbi:hypothetical protein ACVWW6_004242 [Bradyrhizobium sp. USDA 3311]